MTDRPTHRAKATGAAVFPGGYKSNQIELLPDGYWEAQDKAAAIDAIKCDAQQRILEIAPIWKQINDIANPDAEGAAERRAAIDAIRAKSDQDEAKLG